MLLGQPNLPRTQVSMPPKESANTGGKQQSLFTFFRKNPPPSTSTTPTQQATPNARPPSTAPANAKPCSSSASSLATPPLTEKKASANGALRNGGASSSANAKSQARNVKAEIVQAKTSTFKKGEKALAQVKSGASLVPTPPTTSDGPSSTATHVCHFLYSDCSFPID